MQRPSQESARKTTLNLTSMLDVCFLLLIFFIVTSSFAVNEGILAMDLPAARPPARPPTPSQPLRIDLASLGGHDVRIQLNRTQTLADFEDLYRQLAADRYRPEQGTGVFNADDPVTISPGPTVRWDHVVNASNAAIRAGYINVQFTTAR